MDKILFNHKYYKNIVTEFNYDDVRVGEINFGLGNMSIEEIRSRWVCHCDAEEFTKSTKKSIVTTGFGLSGVPHMGTLAQIFGAIKLQKAGLDVQIVLGDLDAYNGKNIPLVKTFELAEKYRKLILNLGFKENGVSVIRDQYSELDILRTMYIAGNYMDDADFDLAEEDLHDLYKNHNKIDKHMSFRRKLSLALMSADFIDLIIRKKINNVLVMLGVDEHKYVIFAQKVIEKINKSYKIDGKISAIYSPIIYGFNGYPKMSKSFPESSLNIEDEKDKVVNLIMNNKNENIDPVNNVVFQMMTLVGNLNIEQLIERKNAYLFDQEKWNMFKLEYVDDILKINSIWKEI